VLEKLRSGETLSANDQAIHEKGLVSVLRSLHDDLDEAVLAAYGWTDLTLPADVDALFQRLVDLNGKRAAEESAGTVRYLRPLIQKPVSTIEQGKLDVGAAAPQSAPAATTTPSTIAKRPWPSELPTQIKAVADTLAMAGQPATIEVIGSWFSGKGPWRKRLPVILQSLEAMGRVRRLDDGRWGVSMPT
jgi:hypothetical protein